MLDVSTDATGLRARFEEAYEVVLQAMASEEWLARWRRDGWQDLRAAAMAEPPTAELADDASAAGNEPHSAPETASDQPI
jgi:hypothetical protein